MNPVHEDGVARNLYFDRQLNIDAAKLLPGEYYATGKDMLLVTVLGSCVAACIRDKVSGVGGMNHFMLPDSGQDESNPLSTSARYGTYAMEMLINQIMKLGARRANLEAKLFGGGNVLPGLTVSNIGERNAQFALQYLATEGMKLAAKDLLDIYPRKVHFFPKTGKVLVKKLKSVHNTTIATREREYSSRLKHTQVQGDVELFS